MAKLLWRPSMGASKYGGNPFWSAGNAHWEIVYCAENNDGSKYQLYVEDAYVCAMKSLEVVMRYVALQANAIYAEMRANE